MTKLMTAHEAISRFVEDGDTVYAGFTTVPFGLCYEVVRQGKQRLEVVGGSLNHQASIMMLAGCADRVRTGYLAAALRPGIVTRMMAEGRLQVVDYSNGSIALMLMAGALGLPYVPVPAFLGTDYLGPDGGAPALNRDPESLAAKWTVVESPFDGRPAVALPALRPDVALLHAHRADTEGNVQTWGHQGDARWAYWAARKLIVSVEEIVEPEVIRADPSRTVVPGFKVSAIVHMPWGAHPSGLVGHYEYDYAFFGQPIDILGKEEDWAAFAAEWIYGVEDHEGYLAHYRERFGQPALDRLIANAGPTAAPVAYTHARTLYPGYDPQ